MSGIRTEIAEKIMKHLSAGPMAWSDVVSKVANEIDCGSMFVEAAMRDLVEKKKLQRHEQSSGFAKYSLAGPDVNAPGRVEGKYDSPTEKRLDVGAPSKGWNQKYDQDPWHKDVKGPNAV